MAYANFRYEFNLLEKEVRDQKKELKEQGNLIKKLQKELNEKYKLIEKQQTELKEQQKQIKELLNLDAFKQFIEFMK